MSDKIITKTAINRLIKDIKEIKLNDLSKEGCYYYHDDNNVLLGYALIIGPKDTPYQYGFFLFKFEFPFDYPFSPPIVKYLTNDGKTRFNPNFYKNEKVCLSTLNTWKGEQWTSCQSIRTILLTLLTTMNSEPLCNEPGITNNHIDFYNYNKIIEYRTIEVAIIKTLKLDIAPDITNLFIDTIKSLFIENFEKIKEITKKDNITINTSIYNMSLTSDFNKLTFKLDKLYKQFNKFT